MAVVLIPIVLFLLGSGIHWTFGLLIAAGAGYFAYKSYAEVVRWNNEEFPKLYARWQATYRCNRCGNVFLVGPRNT